MSALTAGSSLASRELVLSVVSCALEKPLSDLSLEENFISNGGDSLASIRLQASLREHNISVSVLEIFSARTLLLLAEYAQLIDTSESDSSLVMMNDELLDGVQKTPQGCPWTSSAGPGDYARYPMTEMQLCLVRSSQKNPGRNIISYIEKHPPEQISALKHAWKQALGSESIFRASFHVDEHGGWMYERQGDMPFIWEQVDVTDEVAYREEIDRPLPLDVGLGTNFKVVTLRQIGGVGCEARDESTIIWRLHHVLVDIISADLILSKVRSVLAGENIRQGPSFPEFALQLQSLQERGFKSASFFWTSQTEKYPSPATQLLLPSPCDGQGEFGSSLGRISVQFVPGSLATLAKRLGVTTASLHYTAWALVLARYTDYNSVSLGAILSGRNLPINGIQSIVGPTINTLPLYVSLEPRESLSDLSRRVFSSLLDLTLFQWSTPDHGFSRGFSSAVNVLPETPSLNPSFQVDSSVRSDFPIQVDVHSCGRICITYDRQAFFGAHIHRMATALLDALDAIQKPEATVLSCLDSLVGTQQRESLADMGNWRAETTRDRFYGDSLVSLFDYAAKADPSAVAVDHSSRRLTYGELQEQSSQVARHLTRYIDSGDVVCVHADGSPEWIISIYAVLRAGATYCPLDPALPEAVRARNFLVAGARVFLTGTTSTMGNKPTSCSFCLSVGDLLLRDDIPEKAANTRAPRPDSIAYMCLTSGSTGTPKAVRCRHIGLVAFQTSLEVRLYARPGWRIAQFMSPAFDGSIHEIFSALSYGATLVLKDKTSPFENLKTSDAAILTPSVAGILDPEDFPNLKALYLVGEAVPQGVCNAWASKCQLFNMYGPTEATCGATIKKLKAQESVTLGHPNPSTRVYILDSQRRLAPWGATGQIYLAGVQVAVGYAGKPDETAERFLPDAVDRKLSGEFMYKTGDAAYWDERGELVFLGRRDREIKLQGFRINLDDLETQLKLADEQCVAAAVTRQQDYLVALVQPADLNLERFAAQMRSHIPIYARPRHVLAVDSFPMNRIGKLDYNAIAATSFTGPGAASRNVSRTAYEQLIAGAVREVLKLPTDCDIDSEAVLSELGVNSIVAISLAQQLSRSLRRRIQVRAVLTSSTIHGLACALAKGAIPDKLLVGSQLGQQGVSPIEREWWNEYRRGGGSSSFNVSYACELGASLDKAKLAAAWNKILKRHGILRSRYRWSEMNGLVRRYAKKPPTATLTNDIDLQRKVNAPFNLSSEDDIIRVLVSPTRMLVVVSHIVCDLTTLQILLREVAQVYGGKEPAPIRKTYAQTIWSQLSPPSYLSFWTDYLFGAPHFPFPLGKNGVRRTTWTGTSYICQIPAGLYKTMLSFTARNKVTMHQLALAALALALQYGDAGCDITFGAPYLNRDAQDCLDVVGLFLEPLPIRIRYPLPPVSESLESLRPASPSQDSFLGAVQRSSRAALSHAVPWDQLLARVGGSSDSVLNNQIFDAMVTFHETGQDVFLSLAETSFVPTCAEGAKFKLMAEFLARGDSELALRLEYSDECFTKREVIILKDLIQEALVHLTTGESYHVTVEKLRRLRLELEES
ncbi:acetyl-CoA synthetase-like protein [Hypoxylon sp. FL1284]|nr:acetyl-CoA synthetase-like protein [Hypoxylon sp. FL1284]